MRVSPVTHSLYIIMICMMARAQGPVTTFPFTEAFDAAIPPALPEGWTSSRARNPGNDDFVTTPGTPRSSPNAVLCTNATVGQWLASPLLSFRSVAPAELSFALRRSSTFGAAVVVEASFDSGKTYPCQVGDTLLHRGPVSYVVTQIALTSFPWTGLTLRIRWRVVPAATGSAGTLRLDDVSLSVRPAVDLALRSALFDPRSVIPGAPVMLRATVENRGTATVPEFTVRVLAEADSLPAARELLASVDSHMPVSPGESLQVSIPLSALPRVPVIVQVLCEGDGVPDNDTATIPLPVSPGAAVINEVMYAPAAGEPEWIEIQNESPSGIELRGWAVGDAPFATRHTIVATSRSLPSGGYLVLTRDASTMATRHPDIMDLVVQVPGFPSLNNDGDGLALYDGNGATIDSVVYSPLWGGAGVSMERVDSTGESTAASNWMSCRDPGGSTPARRNSVARENHDLAAVRVWPGDYPPGPATLLRLSVVNRGRERIGRYGVHWLEERIAAGGEAESIGRQEVLADLGPGDSAHIGYEWGGAGSGWHDLLAVVECPGDARAWNDTARGTVVMSCRQGAVVVNEIMFSPLAGDAEFVELLNRSPFTIEIRGWSVADRPASSGSVNRVTLESLRSPPGGFIVVAADSTIVRRFPGVQGRGDVLIANRSALGLNADGDDVVVRDAGGKTIDSVAYLPTWHNPDVSLVAGRSLERISANDPSCDRRNWGTSAHPLGGTPGAPNSIVVAPTVRGGSLAASPNPFSPDNDGHDDHTVIRYGTPWSTCVIRVKIYDVRGRLVRRLAECEPGGMWGEVVWDGRDDERKRVRIGIYIVMFEAVGPGGDEPVTYRMAVVVAGRL